MTGSTMADASFALRSRIRVKSLLELERLVFSPVTVGAGGAVGAGGSEGSTRQGPKSRVKGWVDGRPGRRSITTKIGLKPQGSWMVVSRTVVRLALDLPR
jgi:hypothetical protein